MFLWFFYIFILYYDLNKILKKENIDINLILSIHT